jgi:feruloyl esterase
MRRRHKLSDASSVFLLACVTLIPTQARAARCENLTKLNLPDVTITSSTNMPAGRFTPPGSSNSIETHEFCRVIAVAKPTSDSVLADALKRGFATASTDTGHTGTDLTFAAGIPKRLLTGAIAQFTS